MEIIPRIPVPGENPNRRFVGIVDDDREGKFYPCSEAITDEAQLILLCLAGFDIIKIKELPARIRFFKAWLELTKEIKQVVLKKKRQLRQCLSWSLIGKLEHGVRFRFMTKAVALSPAILPILLRKS